MSARITNREITLRIEPERVLGATFAFMQDCLKGTVFEVQHTVGTVSSTNGLVFLRVPKAQISSDLTLGDREGIETLPFDLQCTGDVDDELTITHLFV